MIEKCDVITRRGLPQYGRGRDELQEMRVKTKPFPVNELLIPFNGKNGSHL